jgi:4'-phosphopantetheinyl transferase
MASLIDSWPKRADVPPLEQDTIHIWRISLDEPTERIRSLRELLTDPEQQQADRFLFAEHRQRFTVGRAQLRRILGGYIDVAPERVDFRYTNLGKPYFAEGVSDPHLEFNFTNSNDWALLAITHQTNLGIDIEKIREMTNMEGLARRFFAQPEIDVILQASSELRRQEYFFRCWTRKEAFLKAIGTGLTFPLDNVCVSVDDAEPVGIQWIKDRRDEACRWELTHVTPCDGYVGALARQSVGAQLMSWHWAV